jgi:hypothetical protein
MKIQTYQGGYDETCTVSTNLTANQQKKPIIRDIIQYAEPRMLSTLIVSGAKSPWDLQPGRTPGDGALKTKIGTVPKGKLIGDNAYRYNIMGRIQQKTVVVSQQGTTAADGTFQLFMKDNMLYPGLNTKFYTDGFYARVQSFNGGSPGNYLYTFKSVGPVNFNWTIHVAPQQGEKTAYGAFTSYSERSLRGYSRSFYPAQFINHLTTQRKTIAISGDALTDVTWVEVMGSETKGWFYTKEAQGRLQLMQEDEHAKFFGQSSMKDVNGNLLPVSTIIDPETGEQVVEGDGLLPQIDGQNSIFGSDTDGGATITDMQDMMIALEKRSNSVYGKMWYVVTGTDGYRRAQDMLQVYHVNNMGGRSTNGSNTQKVGGEDIPVGGNFDTFNYSGNQIILVKHPMFDDTEKWFERSSTGALLQSNMMIFLDMGASSNGPNIEILGKGAYGVNRTNVSGYINGITGDERDMVSSVDAIEWNTLKQDGIFVYNTQSCGVIRMSPN